MLCLFQFCTPFFMVFQFFKSGGHQFYLLSLIGMLIVLMVEELSYANFVISTLCLVPTKLKMLFQLFLNFQIFFFVSKLFQSLKLIKYLLIYSWHKTHPLSTKTFEMFTSTIIYCCQVSHLNGEQQFVAGMKSDISFGSTSQGFGKKYI